MPIPVLVKALLSHRQAKPAGNGRCGGFYATLKYRQRREGWADFTVKQPGNGGFPGKIMVSKRRKRMSTGKSKFTIYAEPEVFEQMAAKYGMKA